MGIFQNSDLMQAVFVVLAGILYIIPLQKREPMEQRLAISLSLGFLCIIAMEFLLPQMFWVKIGKIGLNLLVISAMIYHCTQLRKSASFYVAIWSVVTSQFLMNLWYALLKLNPFRNRGSEGALALGLILFYLVGLAVIGATIARKMPENGKYNIGPRQMTVAVFFLIVFEALNQMMILVYLDRYDLMFYIVLLVVQLYCVSLLYLQTELFKKSALEKELLTKNMLMKQKETQYALTRENMDLINRKCHDLKHQVRALRSVADEESKERYLSELEKSVEIYGAIVKTGNDVLDTILTEKSLLCQAKGIKINCVADGRRLDFVDPVDLYGILGNAVDNAIEAVEKFENAKMRLIDISIFVRERFLVVTISNPMREQLTFKNGIPVSTKPRTGYHGYGLRSIRHSLQRYDGTMSVSVENHTFILKMLLPLPQTT